MAKKRTTGDSDKSSHASAEPTLPAPGAAAGAVASSPGSSSSLRGWGATLWGWCNLSTLSCLVMAYYVYVTVHGVSGLMHPFDGVTALPGAPTVPPLWPDGAPVSVFAYLSTSKAPSAKAFNGSDPNLPVVWLAGSAAHPLAYSEHAANLDRRLELIAPDAKGEAAKTAAAARLAAKKARLEEAGGSLLMMAANYLFEEDAGEEAAAAAKGELLTVAGRKMWDKARSGQQVYLHVVVARGHCDGGSAAACRFGETARDKTKALRGTVELVKFDKAEPERQKRWLLQDLGLGGWSGVAKYPDAATLAARAALAQRNQALERALASKQPHPLVAKWKPEVAVRLVVDTEEYPVGIGAPHSSAASPLAAQRASYALEALRSRIVQAPSEGGGLFHVPVLHVDEIGLTSDKYLPLNDTVGSLPLKLTFSPMAAGRLRLMSHFAQSLEGQKELGFSDTDIDDVRRLVSDTSVYLLAVTMLASVLHLLFEFLAFKSDVQFWRQNKSLRGLSVRTLFVDLFSQTVILLFLMDTETSLLVTVPSAFGVAIQLWKCQRATGLAFQMDGWKVTWVAHRMTDEGHAAAGAAKKTDSSGGAGGAPQQSAAAAAEAAAAAAAPASLSVAAEKKAAQAAADAADAADVAAKTAETMRVDQMAVSHMSVLLLPLVVGFALRSLVYEQHFSWYSWAIAALTGTVYTFGFILMTPQLFINHHLKSVSHLPWKFLCFRFVNTFIDDLFAFIIRMPTMHRISCFRDDVVFFVYLYQRWAYPVDKSRGVALEDMAA